MKSQKEYIKTGVPIYRYESNNSKFFESNLKDLFESDLMYLNKSEELNDPFDILPIFEGEIKKQDLEKLLSVKTPLNRQERRKFSATSTPDDHPNKVFEKHFYSTLNAFGIKCFSRTNANILMWSYYANAHKGICLGFIPKKESCLFNNAPVIYTTLHPTVRRYLLSVNGNELFQRQVTYLLRCKSINWAHEEEQRVAFDKLGGEKIKLQKNDLAYIYLGAGIDRETEKLVRRINTKTKNLPIYKCELSRQNFGIEFRMA